jgi:hypothetical protein
MVAELSEKKLGIRDLRDLLVDPAPSVEVAYKGWLDLSVEEEAADLAKDVLAMANSGGGYIILGYHQGPGKWVPDIQGQRDLGEYRQDAIDRIVERYADVPLRCSSRIVKHARNQRSYPVIVVPDHPGRPVFARQDGPDGQLQELGYYIRRPGPVSTGPVSTGPETREEWEGLFTRCLTYARNYYAVSHWIKIYGKKLADEIEG